MFFPRGGSAHVARALARQLPASGWDVTILSGSRRGADAISDPDFGFADPSNGRTLATRAALADARRRADDAAAVAGLRITGVRSVNLDPSSDGGFDDSDSGATTGGGAEKRPSTTVSPGTRDFTEFVRVIYTAAPAT
jgi:uncharacterized protein YggE